MEPATRNAWIPIVAVAVACTMAPLLVAGPAVAETHTYSGSTGRHGVTLTAESPTGVDIHFEVSSFSMEPVDVNGDALTKIIMPQVFLPGDAGAPDLPSMGRVVAVPRGATARVEIVSSTTQRFTDVDLAPAPVIPRETDDSPLRYERNEAIFGQDAFYPAQPVIVSETGAIRGVDVVRIGISPFQYNPVTRELVVHTELDVHVSFEGGTGVFGEQRLRNRFWESILENELLNYASLPPLEQRSPADSRNGYEYLIICPDDPDFIAWADTLKSWRTLEGISTEVFTTTDIGGTSAMVIEAWLDNAYQYWDPAPAAFLILGDYPDSGDDGGVTAPIWDSYCVSDNIYADVDGDDLPDMFHGRITARNAADLEVMIGKMLSYERQPYTDPGFYDHPIIAGGWQTERWFILCTEICLGHQVNVLGKDPVREYAIYQGSPTVWSTNQNTGMLLEYFGTPPTYPDGLGYIPDTPAHLTDWGSNATRINNDINEGAYMLLHRDHGYEAGWGEPDYSSGDLTGLTNDMYPFVFSINCLTGKYNNGTPTFTEHFHRRQHGALGLIAASEVSYSFVNDTFIFGLFDGMWPEFMPDYGPYEPESRFHTELRPGLGMANGKYFLESSNWPYNSGSKDVTYHLFHHHGDTFVRMYSEVPQHLTVDHPSAWFIESPTFPITADEGAVIALTVDGEIIGVADATGIQQDMEMTPLAEPCDMRITITKANHYRYDVTIPISSTGPFLMLGDCTVLDPGGDNDGVLDACETAGLSIELANAGLETATAVSAELTSADPYVTINTPTQSYPDIAVAGSAAPLEPFEVEVSGSIPDGHAIDFALAATSAEGNWDCPFSLTVEAPNLIAGRFTVDDSGPSGNGNGRVDPGETVILTLAISNTGHSPTADLEGVLSTANPDLTLLDDQGQCPPLAVGGDGVIGTFELEAAAGCPWVLADFSLAVTSDGCLAVTVPCQLRVGPWFDDCEEDRGWTLGADDDDATNGMWVLVDPVGTEFSGQPVQSEDDHTADPGIMCFVTGNTLPGEHALYGDVDDGKTTLLSPWFDMTDAASVTLSYWRWYTNDLFTAPGEDYWDVDVTADGGDTWVHLEHTLESANSWNEFNFDIGTFVAFTDSVRFRFVAQDYGQGSLVDAAVDDIVVDVVYQATAGAEPVNVEAVRAANGIVALSPNPFNPHTTITYQVGSETPVSLRIYDVHGRMVRALVEDVVAAGEHSIVFDGRTSSGAALASGVYFLRMETPEIMQVRQLTLLK